MCEPRLMVLSITTETYTRADKTWSYYMSVKNPDAPNDSQNHWRSLVFFYCSYGAPEFVIGKLVKLDGPKFITRSGEEVQHLQKYTITNTILKLGLDLQNVLWIPKCMNLLSKPPNSKYVWIKRVTDLQQKICFLSYTHTLYAFEGTFNKHEKIRSFCDFVQINNYFYIKNI
jgi:hypothetical protein